MNTSSLPAVRRQHLLAEFAGLKQACPHGIFVSLTPGDPTVWSGVMFVRKGPYAPAILRFHISFPDAYPALPPLVTFSTDMFHPLITPLTTYMYSTDVQDGGTASAHDDERLPPGGFSLRHGFPGWFGRARRAAAAAAAATVTATAADVAQGASSGSGSGSGGSDSTGDSGAKGESHGDAAAAAAAAATPPRPVATATGTTTASAGSAASSSSSSVPAPGYARTGGARDVSTYEVLRYIRSTFDDEDVLDSVPLEAAGNPGAWHAWRTHRRHVAAKGPSGAGENSGREGGGGGAQADKDPAPSPVAAAAARRPDEWNWEGVWEERVKRNIASSLSEGVLYGHAGAPDEVINFLNMDEAEVDGAKTNLLQTLGATAYSAAVERWADGQVPNMAIGSEHEDVTPWRAMPRPLHIAKRFTQATMQGRTVGSVILDPSLGRHTRGTPRHGIFLCDVALELLPLSESTVVEVLGDRACPKILHPESRLLFVAQIRLGPVAHHGRRTNHVRQKSDDLIEDLEAQLGGIVTEYLEIRVTYRHPGYPQRHSRLASVLAGSPGHDGLSGIQTTIQTTATASIRRHNTASRWSPLPCTPRPNRLFEVVASHWGADKAHAVMQRVIRSRWIRPRPDDVGAPPTGDRHGGPPERHDNGKPGDGESPPRTRPSAGWAATLALGATPSPPTRAAPPAPPRRTSRPRDAVESSEEEADVTGGHSEEDDHTETETETETETSPTETVRRRIRRGGSDRRRRAASVFRSPSPSPPSASSPLSPSSPTEPTPSSRRPWPRDGRAGRPGPGRRRKSASSGSPERARTGGLAGKWLAGADVAPVALDPVVADAEMDGGGRRGGMAGVNAGSRGTRRKEREAGWRWGWAGWW
ncbi:hypothetical protein VTH06DRAFT_3041 [Thermothelomyces fergusii]